MKKKQQKKLKQVQSPKWDRIRTLLNVAGKAIGLGPLEAKVSDEGQGEFQMEVTYGYSIWWDGGKYTVQHSTVIRGVRYTRNGDGWPDDYDVVDVSEFQPREIDNMVRLIIGSIAIDRIYDTLDDFFNEEILDTLAQDDLESPKGRQ